MMILLTQEEYNELLKKGNELEVLVDEQVQKEKDKIRSLLQQAFNKNYEEGLRGENLLVYIRNKLNEILS